MQMVVKQHQADFFVINIERQNITIIVFSLENLIFFSTSFLLLLHCLKREREMLGLGSELSCLVCLCHSIRGIVLGVLVLVLTFIVQLAWTARMPPPLLFWDAYECERVLVGGCGGGGAGVWLCGKNVCTTLSNIQTTSDERVICIKCAFVEWMFCTTLHTHAQMNGKIGIRLKINASIFIILFFSSSFFSFFAPNNVSPVTVCLPVI